MAESTTRRAPPCYTSLSAKDHDGRSSGHGAVHAALCDQPEPAPLTFLLWREMTLLEVFDSTATGSGHGVVTSRSLRVLKPDYYFTRLCVRMPKYVFLWGLKPVVSFRRCWLFWLWMYEKGCDVSEVAIRSVFHMQLS